MSEKVVGNLEIYIHKISHTLFHENIFPYIIYEKIPYTNIKALDEA